MASVFERRKDPRGLRMIDAPKYLRFFQASFEPVGVAFRGLVESDREEVPARV